MIINRLQIFIEFLQLAMEFLVVFIQAVGAVIHQSSSPVLRNASYGVPASYVGLLP
ncbi:hypothetical protein NMG60_11019650 [Bertholletia excelsa]